MARNHQIFVKGVFQQTEATVSTIVTDIGTFFQGAIAWVGDVVDIVVAEPLLMVLVVAVPLSGIAIGYLGRLIRL